MRRSTSEVIKNLEMRVAKLENQRSRVAQRWLGNTSAAKEIAKKIESEYKIRERSSFINPHTIEIEQTGRSRLSPRLMYHIVSLEGGLYYGLITEGIDSGNLWAQEEVSDNWNDILKSFKSETR